MTAAAAAVVQPPLSDAFQGYRSSIFYPVYEGASTNTVAATAGIMDTVITLLPYAIRRPVLITSMAVRVTNGQSAIANCAVKMAIWKNNPLLGQPMGLPVAGSETEQSAATQNTTPTITGLNYLAVPGTYWFGVAIESGDGGLGSSFVSVANGGMLLASRYGRSSALTNNNVVTGFTMPFTYDSQNIMDLDTSVLTLSDAVNAAGVPISFFA